MPGTFIISLDCEGKWGIADRTKRIESGFITKKSLMGAYEILTRQLDEFEMPATFAFVMAFTLKDAEVDEWLPRLTDVQVDGLNWMRNFRRAEKLGDFSGWFCSEAFELVRDCGRHEIGCHGFRHLPLAEHITQRAEANYELENASALAKMKGIELKTFVFPRNNVGHLNELARQGYIGFRNSHPTTGRHGRVGNLLREFNIWEGAQCSEPSSYGMVSIPGGYFLNWRHGVRRRVPQTVTLLRWRSILQKAVKGDHTALLFLHPHNVIDGHEMTVLFRDVLRIAADLRNRNGLLIATQKEYCERIQTSSSDRRLLAA
jgi:peptidoglycan/xylan/chitin deacetylase (PgdA/CDA1 family)